GSSVSGGRPTASGSAPRTARWSRGRRPPAAARPGPALRGGRTPSQFADHREGLGIGNFNATSNLRQSPKRDLGTFSQAAAGVVYGADTCLAKLRVSPAATVCNESSCAARHGRLFTVATVRACPPPLRKSRDLLRRGPSRGGRIAVRTGTER